MCEKFQLAPWDANANRIGWILLLRYYHVFISSSRFNILIVSKTCQTHWRGLWKGKRWSHLSHSAGKWAHHHRLPLSFYQCIVRIKGPLQECGGGFPWKVKERSIETHWFYAPGKPGFHVTSKQDSMFGWCDNWTWAEVEYKFEIHSQRKGVI